MGFSVEFWMDFGVVFVKRKGEEEGWVWGHFWDAFWVTNGGEMGLISLTDIEGLWWCFQAAFDGVLEVIWCWFDGAFGLVLWLRLGAFVC